MTAETRCISIADRINKILRAGLTLNQDLLHYIDSTFLNPSVKELESIINNESEPDREALMELIFFPDKLLQVQLEKILENEPFHVSDEKKIARLLIEKKTETTLMFPDNRGSLRVAIQEQTAHKFVSRLKLSKQLDTKLLEAINSHVPPEYSDLIKVILRNSKLILTKRRIFFMCSFFKTIRADEPVLFQCLSFILNFLDEIDDNQNILSFLLKKKSHYQNNIRKAEQFNKQIAGSNMEILILQGNRVPHISKEEACKNIELIDRISLAVFGQIGYPEPVYSGFDFGSFHGEKDMEKLIKILS